MATSTIVFEDADGEQTAVTLNFDSPLPDDPAEASPAQLHALIVFNQIMEFSTDSPNGEPDFDAEEAPSTDDAV